MVKLTQKMEAIKLYPNGEYMSDFIRTYKTWKPSMTKIITKLFEKCPKNTVFIDIGAGIGYFSLIALSNKLKVVAFEPIASNFNLLSTAISETEYKDNIVLYMSPLWSCDKIITLNVLIQDMSLTSINTMPEITYKQTSLAVSFDSFIGQTTSANVIIKISGYGSETDILFGMQKILTTCCCIFIDITEFRQEMFDILIKDKFFHIIHIDNMSGNTSRVSYFELKYKIIDNPCTITTAIFYKNEHLFID